MRILSIVFFILGALMILFSIWLYIRARKCLKQQTTTENATKYMVGICACTIGACIINGIAVLLHYFS